MSKKHNGHGGKRKGSGNKKGSGFFEASPISVKLSKGFEIILELESKETGKTKSELIRAAIYEKYHPMADYTK